MLCLRVSRSPLVCIPRGGPTLRPLRFTTGSIPRFHICHTLRALVAHSCPQSSLALKLAQVAWRLVGRIPQGGFVPYNYHKSQEIDFTYILIRQLSIEPRCFFPPETSKVQTCPPLFGSNKGISLYIHVTVIVTQSLGLLSPL